MKIALKLDGIHANEEFVFMRLRTHEYSGSYTMGTQIFIPLSRLLIYQVSKHGKHAHFSNPNPNFSQYFNIKLYFGEVKKMPTEAHSCKENSDLKSSNL